MQFKVPQDVQQADRIVSFLTFPQLIICVIGFAVAYAIYTVLQKQGLPLPLILIPVGIVGLLTAAFAFLKIVNLRFHRYLALVIERLITPSKRTWQKGADHVEVDASYQDAEDQKKAQKSAQASSDLADKESKLSQIEQITDILDSTKKEPSTEKLSEIDQADDKSLLQTAFLNEEKTNRNSTEKKKEEKSVEEKIVELSKTPGKTETPKQAPHNQPIPPKKKRRRKRKKKKKNNFPTNPPLTPISTPKPTPVHPELAIAKPQHQAPESTAEKVEPVKNTNPAETPANQPAKNQAQLSNEYSAADLQKGQEIKFPHN